MMHIRIAEQGKVFCLEGNHTEALRYYRESMRLLGLQGEGNDVFFQHYSQCIMESLEKSGGHEEVINYCDKFLETLAQKDLENDSMLQSIAGFILQRKAIQYIYLESNEEASMLLEEAISMQSGDDKALSTQLLGWLHRGYTITHRQLQDTLNRSSYYIVRADRVNKNIAITLPQTIKPGFN